MSQLVWRRRCHSEEDVQDKSERRKRVISTGEWRKRDHSRESIGGRRCHGEEDVKAGNDGRRRCHTWNSGEREMVLRKVISHLVVT